MIRFAEVMLWLSLVVLVVWGVYAAAAPIYLHACSKTTCETHGSETGSVADADLMARDVQLVADSKECPDKCATVHYGTAQAHVIGHWLDIGCRAWGGSPCMWDRKTYSEEKLKGLMEERYRE